MCNETGIPELLESRILGIPVVAIVTSHTRSLRDPTQQDFIHARTLPIYMCHTRFKFLRTLQSTLCKIEYNQEGTPKITCTIIF